MMSLLGEVPPHRIVAYPSRPKASTKLGYNLGGYHDAAHIDLGIAGGASIFRVQFGWDSVEDYSTGNLSLSADSWAFLNNCASRGVKPMIVAGYGPPYITIGTLTTTATIPINSPAGTDISVQAHGFSIDTSLPICFVGDVNGGSTQYTGRASYYGSLITYADSGKIRLAAATRVAIPSGHVMTVHKHRYSTPKQNGDPGVAAFIRYCTFLAQCIHDAGAQGYVCLWNELVWPHDYWGSTSSFYDVTPGDVDAAGFSNWKYFTQAAQAQPLPPGTSFINGASDKTGFSAVRAQGIAAPGSISHEGFHPYGDNPESHCWDYYLHGYYAEFAPPPVAADYGHAWWEHVEPLWQASNFRFAAFLNDYYPNSPGIMASEMGVDTADDTQHAKYLTRRVASLWGMNITPVPYVLDEGPGTTMSLAPNSVPRPAYYSLKLMMDVIGRMTDGDDNTTAPSVIGWGSAAGWPLMTVTVHGAKGNAVMFLWQRSYSDTNWFGVAVSMPPYRDAVVSNPPGSTVKECVDLIDRGGKSYTDSGGVTIIPIRGNPIAVRWGP